MAVKFRDHTSYKVLCTCDYQQSKCCPSIKVILNLLLARQDLILRSVRAIYSSTKRLAQTFRMINVKVNLPRRIEMFQIKILIPNENVLIRRNHIRVQKSLGIPPVITLKISNHNVERRTQARNIC
jgi:hypothetical protein